MDDTKVFEVYGKIDDILKDGIHEPKYVTREKLLELCKSLDKEYYCFMEAYLKLKFSANHNICFDEFNEICKFFNQFFKDNNTSLNEADSMGKTSVNIKLDNDGKLILENKENVNYQQIYMQSHTLLKSYETSHNIEGIKYELCKLWHINVILENRIIHPNNKLVGKINKHKREEAIKTRAFIKNDFNKYLKIVSDIEPNFNFHTFYMESPFYSESIIIDDNKVNMGLKLLKFLKF